VPLNGEHVMTGQFHRLDDTVWCGRRDDEIVTEDRERLVVKRVDANLRRVQRREQRSGNDIHLVRAFVTIGVPLRMPRAVVDLDVLVQCAAVIHVGELGPSTDRQDRHFQSTGLAKERQFPLVAVRFDGTEILIGVVPVAVRFHVRAPAQDQTIESSEHTLDVGVARQFDG